MNVDKISKILAFGNKMIKFYTKEIITLKGKKMTKMKIFKNLK